MVILFCGVWALLFAFVFDSATAGAVFGTAHLTAYSLARAREIASERLEKPSETDDT